MKIMKNILELWIIVLLLIFINGCASELTDKTINVGGSDIVPEVREMQLTMTLRGTPSAANKYYFIFSPTNNINILGPNYFLGSYFLVPGMPYTDEQQLMNTYYANAEDKTLQDIYDDFFSSWQDIISYDDDFYSLNNGPFVSANQHLSYNPININTQSEMGINHFTFKIDLNWLSLADRLYFYILAVDESDQLRDYTESICYIDIIDGQTGEGQDISEGGLPADLDIISWQARIDIY